MKYSSFSPLQTCIHKRGLEREGGKKRERNREGEGKEESGSPLLLVLVLVLLHQGLEREEEKRTLLREEWWNLGKGAIRLEEVYI